VRLFSSRADHRVHDLFRRKPKEKASFHLLFIIFAGLASGPAYRWAKENPGVGFGLFPAALAWTDCGLLFLNMVYDVYICLRYGEGGLRIDLAEAVGL
jgi:hypothetical protein